MNATIDIVNTLSGLLNYDDFKFDTNALLKKFIFKDMKYGSKDLMRITDIRKKSGGDIVEEFKLALRMANEIELPGKAIARGWAAVEVYRNGKGNPDQYSPIAAIFFQRACELAGEDDINDIKAMASANTVGDSDEDIEAAFENVPTEKQPASRRELQGINMKIDSRVSKRISDLIPLEKINVVKGEGPNFNVFYTKTGTVEIWMTDENKFRMIYTGSPEPTSNMGDKKEFRFEDRRETWTMVDYTEVYNMQHLMPLYGPSLTSYMYN
jgi:hypothetical protein